MRKEDVGRKTMKIDRELADELAAFCRERGLTQKVFLEAALREYLRKAKDREKKFAQAA